MPCTTLLDVLGIEFPIVQAPIGSATSPQLTAAVSNAGGLGMLALSWKDLQSARRAIRDTRDLTSRPFGVNLVLEWVSTKVSIFALRKRSLCSPFSGAIHPPNDSQLVEQL
jgi:nitronate monooxygenase